MEAFGRQCIIALDDKLPVAVWAINPDHTFLNTMPDILEDAIVVAEA